MPRIIASTHRPMRRWADALLLLGLTVALRAWQIGDPAVGMDQQFYQLVGERMVGGAWLYRDIIDVKPPGIFVLHYLATAAFPAWPAAIQWFALACAWGTSLLVFVIGRHWADRGSALIAAFLYLAYLTLLEGFGAQSPVIYNLFVAGAALATLGAVRDRRDRGRLFARGSAAMLLCGLALVVKPTAVFEGVFFGLVLAWAAWRDRARVAGWLVCVILWIAIALLPAAATYATFAAQGTANDLIENVVWMVLRARSASGAGLRLVVICGLLLPLLGLSNVALRRMWRGGTSLESTQRAFATGWLLVAIGGFLVFGTYYDHYAQPLLVPLTSVAAVGLMAIRGRRAVQAILVIAVIAVLIGGGLRYRKAANSRGSEAEFATISTHLRTVLAGRCLYVMDAPPALYSATGACFATRFVFPHHLMDEHFAGFPETSQTEELRRILAAQPGAVVMRDRPSKYASPAAWSFLTSRLRRDYTLTAVLPLGKRRYQVWGLKAVVGQRAGSLAPPRLQAPATAR